MSKTNNKSVDLYNKVLSSLKARVPRHWSDYGIALLIEDWILLVRSGRANRISEQSLLAEGKECRGAIDLALSDESDVSIRDLFCYIQELKPEKEQFRSFNQFKDILLPLVKGKDCSVFCPYTTVIFDKIVPKKNLHLYFDKNENIPADCSLVLLERPIYDVKSLQAIFIDKPNRRVFSIDKPPLIDRDPFPLSYKSPLLLFDISISEYPGLLLEEYLPRDKEAKPTITLNDLNSKKSWKIPEYAMYSVKPSSYSIFSQSAFFVDVEKRPATDCNKTITYKSFAGLKNKVNRLKEVDLFLIPMANTCEFRQVSGPAIVIHNGSAIILGAEDKNIAIPKECLSIVPAYLKKPYQRDCIKLLQTHALTLLEKWNPTFDTMEAKLDESQKYYWAHYIEQPLVVKSYSAKGNNLHAFLSSVKEHYGEEYEALYKDETIQKVLLLVKPEASTRAQKAQLAFELSTRFGWVKNTKYLTKEWAEYFNENPGTFGNLFTQAKKNEPLYSDAIERAIACCGDNVSDPPRK